MGLSGRRGSIGRERVARREAQGWPLRAVVEGTSVGLSELSGVVVGEQGGLRLRAGPGAAAEARRWVVEAAHRAGATMPAVRAVELVTSELVTNAVRYGPPDGWVVVKAESRDGELRLAVTDGGDTVPSKREPNRSGGGGFGLHLVERLADEWGVETLGGGAGKTVWVRMSHHGPEGGAFSRAGAGGD